MCTWAGSVSYTVLPGFLPHSFLREIWALFQAASFEYKWQKVGFDSIFMYIFTICPQIMNQKFVGKLKVFQGTFFFVQDLGTLGSVCAAFDSHCMVGKKVVFAVCAVLVLTVFGFKWECSGNVQQKYIINFSFRGHFKIRKKKISMQKNITR